MTQNISVKITNTTLQKIADDTLQFFECTLNTIGHKIVELYNQQSLTKENIETIFPIGNVKCQCLQIDCDNESLLLIQHNEEVLNNRITTTTLFSATNNSIELLEYE